MVDDVHLIVGPLHFVHKVQTAVHDERIHVPRFLTEPCDPIAALLGRAEFELEKRLVLSVDDAEVV